MLVELVHVHLASSVATFTTLPLLYSNFHSPFPIIFPCAPFKERDLSHCCEYPVYPDKGLAPILSILL